MSLVPATKKIPAGICGILFGAFGIHKFLMGFPRAGLTMLGMTIAFRLLSWMHVPFAGTIALGVILLGFIEGVIYLVKSDTDFYRDYTIRRQEWL